MAIHNSSKELLPVSDFSTPPGCPLKHVQQQFSGFEVKIVFSAKESFLSAIKALCSFFTPSFFSSNDAKPPEALAHNYTVSIPEKPITHNNTVSAPEAEKTVSKEKNQYLNMDLEPTQGNNYLLSEFNFYKNITTDVSHMAGLLNISESKLNCISFLKNALTKIGSKELTLTVPLSKNQTKEVNITSYQLLALLKQNAITDPILLKDLATQVEAQLNTIHCEGAADITRMIGEAIRSNF